MEFPGFRSETFDFFAKLQQNNTEEWFEANSGHFEEHVLQPFRTLVQDLGPYMSEKNPRLTVSSDSTDHFSEIRRPARGGDDGPAYKTSFFAFFWDRDLRRLNDGNLYVGVRPEGVSIGFHVYEFGDPHSRMRKVFKPRLRRELNHLDEYIKINYLRRGFQFRRFVRAPGRLGMREVEAFPGDPIEWQNTLGWVVHRHMEPESSRLTPGSFLTELKESFDKLYPLYLFACDPSDSFRREMRVPASRLLKAPPKPLALAVAEAKTSAASGASSEIPKIPLPPKPKPAPKKKATAQADADEKKPTNNEKAPAKKKPAAKKDEPAAKKKTVAKKKPATKKKAVAKKKPATKKKAVAKKKPATKKKAVAKKKPATKKKAVAKKKPATKKKR
jgi:histone H1/5